MNNTPENLIKIYATMGIVTGLTSIAASVVGYIFIAALAFSAGFLALWNIGNLKDQIRAGNTK